MLLSYHKKGQIEAGTDEAGRGCLAGPVVAAAVILPADFSHDKLRDSKKLTAKIREELYQVIKDNAVAYSVQMLGPKKIDAINILNASIEAMHLSLKALQTRPEFILVDGNRFKPFEDVPHACIIKGDDKYLSIAAASILAKVERDRYMKNLSIKYPEYYWHTNKGYPTKQHRSAIKEYGSTKHHRHTFNLLGKDAQMQFFNK